MRIQNFSKRIFICRDGEEITVEVLSKNTVHLVTFRLDQQTGNLNEGETLIFELDQSQADPTLLTMGYHFSGSTGGAYKVEITGDPGEDTFIDIYNQDHVPVIFDQYTFDIWP